MLRIASAETRASLAKAARDAAIMLAFGMAGGAVFSLIRMPLAWTLGPMTVAAVVAIFGARWQMPSQIRDVARPVVGVLAGSSFTPDTLGAIAGAWPAFLFVALYTVLTTVAGWWYFRRLCRQDPVTAFFSSSPGGLGELTLLGGLLGGDMRSLVLTHAIRIVVVVFTVPTVLQYVLGGPLARGLPPTLAAAPELWGWPILVLCGFGGFAVGRLWRFPGGVMVGSMVLSAVAHGTGITHLAPPGWLVILVQIVIGTITGSRFVGVRWSELALVIWQALAWAIVLVIVSVATAVLASHLFHKPFPIFLLAIAPGGMTEMAVIAYAMGIEATFVMICQVGRTFMVSGFMPIASRMLRIGGQDSGAQRRSVRR